MLRVKVPAGQLSAAELRTIGEVSNLYGKGDGELSTRQNIQLHWLELAKLPDIFAHLERSGVTTAGGCGDTVRNITGCPVQGIAGDELFDASPIVTAAADLFYGNPDWANLPRKHKYSISACADRCNAPEINCISLIGTDNDGREGFAVHVGGGLSSVPRIARDMGVFVPKEEANEILGAITSVWSEDLKYRVSRVKARLKFMVDDIGPEGIRERVEARLGRKLEDYKLPPIDVEPSHHLGVHAAEAGGALLHRRPGPPRPDLGRPDDRDRRPRRPLRRRHPADAPAELHRHRHPERARSTRRRPSSSAIGFPLDINPVRGNSIACTGEPHCNFSVAETKTRLGALIDRLDERFGMQIADLRLHLDGCPHACAQHWVGDLGFQGTTSRDEGGVRAAGLRHLRARQPRARARDRPLAVPARADRRARQRRRGADRRLARAPRSRTRTFVSFTRRASDEELGELAGLEPAKLRQREEAE